MIKPSPNEILRFTKDEALQRRRIRLQQVREQEKLIAQQIRNEVRQKQQQEISRLSSALKREWIAKHNDNLAETETKYLAGLNQVGYSHQEAKENSPNQAMRDAEAQRQASIAKIRATIALKNEMLIRDKLNETYANKLQSLKFSQAKERIRAKHIAQLPTIENEIDSLFDKDSVSDSRSSSNSDGQQGMYTTISESSTTTVNLGLPSNDGVVEKEEVFKDARQEAEAEEERLSLLQAEKEKLLMEQLAKAKVRHQVALRKTRLNSVGSKCMQELKVMQKRDAIRRQNNIRYTASFKPMHDIVHANKDMFTDSLLFGHHPPAVEQSPYMMEEDEDQYDLHLHEDQSDLNFEPKPSQSTAMSKLLKQIGEQRKARLEENKLSPLTEEESQEENETITEVSTSEIDQTSAPSDVLPTKTIQNEVEILSQSGDDLSTYSETKIQSDSDEIGTETKTSSLSMENSTQDLKMNFDATIESLKSNRELMKSVEDYQRKILSQRSSSDKIKQQINLLEAKKSKLDHLISEISKPQ